MADGKMVPQLASLNQMVNIGTSYNTTGNNLFAFNFESQILTTINILSYRHRSMIQSSNTQH